MNELLFQKPVAFLRWLIYTSSRMILTPCFLVNFIQHWGGGGSCCDGYGGAGLGVGTGWAGGAAHGPGGPEELGLCLWPNFLGRIAGSSPSWRSLWLGVSGPLYRPHHRPGSLSLSAFVCLHLGVTAAGRKQLGACGAGTVSLRGHCGRQAAFKDCRQQVPVIESRGMVFPHYRKPGMLLGDFYLL